MRATLLIVAALTAAGVSGCAGTSAARRPAHTAPVVSEKPSLSERMAYNRQRAAEQAGMEMTEVRGNMLR